MELMNKKACLHKITGSIYRLKKINLDSLTFLIIFKILFSNKWITQFLKEDFYPKII